MTSSVPLAAATAVDESKLPPAATTQIDFAHDIKPIFDASCIRCHGPVKPKSGFRLDNRADALKGGDNGVDIIPGNSAKSPLIHFTANLVEDMEMPPPNKGKPLSDTQVALLRAWIDQGALWNSETRANELVYSVSPIPEGMAVAGDTNKFRELFWRRAGDNEPSAIDESKLPPRASVQVDFVRDIKPILEASCLRCHSAEKPKGKFRLDNREAALKGGDNGTDILIGASAKSPLIHYVANLVDGMQMPPPDKGEPLTSEQIALLRAWIDQGLPWEGEGFTKLYDVSISPTFGGTVVKGDAHKYRELFWRNNHLDGGVGNFELFQQTGPDTSISASGHAFRDDYKIALSLNRNEIGFVRSGWEQYRKYYDDTGGYRPTNTTLAALSLNRDLHLDIGRAWIDFGLALPDWPLMVFGYEYDYKQGEEAVTAWSSAGSGINQRNLAPATKDIDEHTHIIKFDLDGDIRGVTVEDRFRGEFYSLNTHYTNTAGRSTVFQSVSQENTYFQGANTIRLEKQFRDWLYGSAGYLYSKLDSDASFTNVTKSFNQTFAGSVPDITLERESHVANINGLIGPFDGLTLSTGAQGEWTQQHGFGMGNLNQIPFTFVSPKNLAIVPSTLSSDYDESSAMENVALRYTKIPFTALFAEARLEQQSISEKQSDLQPSGNFVEGTDFSSQLTDFRAGFSTSPWQRVFLSAHYRRYDNDSRYPTNEIAQPAGGYPSFFRSREILTDEIEAKLVVRPCNWLKTTLTYQLLTTDFRDHANPAYTNIANPFATGGKLTTGRYDAQVYSIGAVLTPHPRVYFSASFAYEPSKTGTVTTNVALAGRYRGDTYSVNANGTFVLSKSTDLFAGWIFSEGNYGQNNVAATVPVGMRYQEYSVNAGFARRFNKNISGRLEYGFDYYNEPSSGGANNFRAHTVFATLNVRLP